MANIDISKTKRNARLKGKQAEELAKLHIQQEQQPEERKVKKGCFDYNNMPDNWLFENKN